MDIESVQREKENYKSESSTVINFYKKCILLRPIVYISDNCTTQRVYDVYKEGYIETYLGRRRYLPDITSANWGKKSFAQRCALNTPIQGTAADILKLAMRRIIK